MTRQLREHIIYKSRNFMKLLGWPLFMIYVMNLQE